MNEPTRSLDRTTRTSRRRLGARAPLLVVGAAALVAAVGLAPAGAQTTTTPGPFPFASGMLSSISGSTLEVNGRNGTTQVVVTSSTTYTQTQSATAADVATGDCVRAVGTGSTTGGIVATTVALSKPTSKGCTQTRPGNFRDGQRGNGTGRRFGQGNAGPTGGQPPASVPNGGTRPANFGAAFGTVKSVSGDQVIVNAHVITRPTAKNKKPKTKTENVTVTIGDSTTITQTVSASEKDLAVGSCVNASGKTDSVGTVTADRVSISHPQNGACSAFGFGGGSGGFGGFGRQGQGQSI